MSSSSNPESTAKGCDQLYKELVTRILDVDGKKCLSLSSYTFVDLISELKPIFLNKDAMPTSEYTYFMKHLLSILVLLSVEQLKTIERFCLRMDEDALTGIVKYLDTNDGSKTSNYLYYLFKKYNMEDAGLICEIIKKGHVNISNSLINMLAKNIRINKPMCKYNTKCYRKNIDHLKTYLHN